MTAITRRNLSIVTIAVVSVMTVALGVHAQNPNDGQGPTMGRGRGGPGGFGRGPGGRGGPLGPLGMVNRLNLNDDQRARITELRDSREDETRALADRARAAHEALQAAISADAFDEGAIRARSAEVATVEADMAVARGRLHSDVLEILTPEQRTQLNQLQAAMKERRPDRHPQASAR